MRKRVGRRKRRKRRMEDGGNQWKRRRKRIIFKKKQNTKSFIHGTFCQFCISPLTAATVKGSFSNHG